MTNKQTAIEGIRAYIYGRNGLTPPTKTVAEQEAETADRARQLANTTNLPEEFIQHLIDKANTP